MAASTTLTIRISPELKAKLARLAVLCKRSSSYLATEALTEFVADELPYAESLVSAMADVEAGHYFTQEQVKSEIDRVLAAAAANRKVA